MDLDRAKRILLDMYDPEELVDVLRISSKELLERFEDKVEEYALENDDSDYESEDDNEWTN